MADDQSKKAGRMHKSDTAFDPISAALQQLHNVVASEALPDDFLKILEDIDAKIAAASGTASS